MTKAGAENPRNIVTVYNEILRRFSLMLLKVPVQDRMQHRETLL